MTEERMGTKASTATTTVERRGKKIVVGVGKGKNAPEQKTAKDRNRGRTTWASYLLFAFDTTETIGGGGPHGGWSDYKGSFNTLNAVARKVRELIDLEFEIVQLVDGKSGEVIKAWYIDEWGEVLHGAPAK